MINGIKIMIMEGSELLKNNKDDISIEREYKGVFSDSMLLDQLYKCGIKINKKEESTTDIIMLNFTYGYNSKEYKEHDAEYKQCKKDIKKYTNKLKKADSKEIQELLANALENKAKLDLLKMDKEHVRTELYENGFHLDYYRKNKDKQWVKDYTTDYIFWFRTPSKSRVGDCIFINKKLYDKIIKWQTMGIELQKDENGKVKKVEMEAYKSLTASHKEKSIHIPTKGILVVNDLDSYCKTICSEVYYHVADDEVNPNDTESMCFVRNKENRVKNTLWDGMLLLDKSIIEDNQFMLLRNHYFKACAFSSNIQQFYLDYCVTNGLDYDTYTVKDRYKNDILVKDIVAITTENAMKWEKFYDNKAKGYKDWCDAVIADGEMFGVCKVDHKSKYGEYQRMSYQHINSLPVNHNESVDLVADSKRIIEAYKDNDELFLEHLQRTATEMNNNNMFIDIYRRNSDFANTKLFRDFKTDTISDYKKQLKGGKLLAEGDNLTVCGNPYALLLYSVGALDEYINNNAIEGYEDNTLPILDNGYVSCYTTRFQDEVLTGFRNPHNSFSNILKLMNVRKNDIMDKYFNFGSNVIAINMINTDVQSRASGMDEDSDFIYTTNNIVINNALADKNYPTIVNCIEMSKKTYEDNNTELAKIDNGLAEAKYAIGLSSNVAQLALSWYWKERTQELKDIVNICSVLAQCAIDNSKRLYEVDLNAEVARIQKLECMQKKIQTTTIDKNGEEKIKELAAKPYFWQFVKEIKEKERKYNKDKNKEQEKINKAKATSEARKEKNKKKDDIKKHCIEEKICPMDYIQDGIDVIKNSIRRDKCIDIDVLLQNVEGKAKKEQMDKIVALVKKLDDVYKKQNDTGELEEEEFTVLTEIKADEILRRIRSYSINPKNMEQLIRNTLRANKTRTDAEDSQYQLKLLNCLYRAKKESFLEAWIEK